MSWTKVEKKTSETGDGFLAGAGFLAQGFLSGSAGVWTKIDKGSDSWTKIEKMELT